MVALLTMVFLAVAAPGWGEDGAVQVPPKQRFHLIVLAGQSNMAGRGKVADQDRKPHPRVLVLDEAGRWKPAVDPLHFDKPGVVGVGLGKTFGTILAEANPDVTIGLVPCAVGGSPIDTWKPGGFHGQTKSHPWDDCIKRVARAREDGTVVGILWHQGESDSRPKLAETYESKLHDLITRFRKEFDAPGLPFVAGQMGRFDERPWNESRSKVDAAHRNLPKHVQRTAFVPSTDLTHEGDGVHFDAASYREFGKRYAKSFAELVKTNDE